jgi:hypothetical protein
MPLTSTVPNASPFWVCVREREGEGVQVGFCRHQSCFAKRLLCARDFVNWWCLHGIVRRQTFRREDGLCVSCASLRRVGAQNGQQSVL